MTALVRAAVKSPWRKAWNYVRAVMGDEAYERYVEVTMRKGETPISAEDFYVESLTRRYSTVGRCC
ncbi:MAG: YbdD/YjiX family protein [Vicinamibacteria bacterium]